MKKLFIITLALLSLCSPLQATEFYTSIVGAGETDIFLHASEVSRNCSILDVPTMTVTSPPKHGKIAIFSAKLYPDGFSPNNPRYKCRNVVVEGVQASYTSDPGFSGQDSATIRIDYLYGPGEVRQPHSVKVKTTFKVKR